MCNQICSFTNVLGTLQQSAGTRGHLEPPPDLSFPDLEITRMVVDWRPVQAEVKLMGREGACRGRAPQPVAMQVGTEVWGQATVGEEDHCGAASMTPSPAAPLSCCVMLGKPYPVLGT